MTRIEDIQNKSELVKQYYSWLFDSNDITLEKELDVSIARTYRDPHIYYPTCMHDLFHTQSLRRLGRINHLGSMFQNYVGAYHTRLNHSIGVFGKKQEEHIYLWKQNPEFIQYVEKNGLKKFLIAEEVKMLYHDVGHLPFSHITEQQIIGIRGVHEEIGRDILLTDSEVSIAVSNLGITQELRTVLEQNVLNSSEHDEGNVDVDRMDYLQRDSLHVGGPKFERYPIYSRKIAEINSDGSYRKSSDGNIILSDTLGPNSSFIDVYRHSDFSQIEEFLNGRETQYSNKYFHSSTLTRDTILGLVLSKIAPKNGDLCPDLMQYINFLKANDYTSAAKYDDVIIYKSLIDLGSNCDDPNVVDMVSLLFVPFDHWLERMYEQVDKTKDADFLRTVYKNIIKGNSRFATNIRNPNFFDENVIFAEGKNAFELERRGLSHLIYNSHSFSAYSSKSPVYIEDEKGLVFPLENHPDRSRDWSDTRTHLQVAIYILPWLRLQGLSPAQIEDYTSQCSQIKSDTSIDASLMPFFDLVYCPLCVKYYFFDDEYEH